MHQRDGGGTIAQNVNYKIILTAASACSRIARVLHGPVLQKPSFSLLNGEQSEQEMMVQEKKEKEPV